MDVSQLIIPAFIAGLVTFLAPCTFPFVPAYLGFISGVSGDVSKSARKKVFLNGLSYVLGFSIIFIFFGAFAGFLGASLAPFRIWMTRLAGIFIIFFGLVMLNVVRLEFLGKERQIKFGGLEKGKPLTSFLLGGAFAFGWTPCVGPVLASILLLSSVQATALSGAFLLAVFSAGLAVPFLILALAWGEAERAVQKFSRFLRIFSVIGGILLIFLGILLLTNNFSLLIQWGYGLLQFLNYEKIIYYL